MRAGRPIDAVLCFRRAAHANPRDADARFHLGEVLWQLGLSDEAIAAWRDAAQIDSRFLAARLALAESLLARADYAGAQAAAGEALALAPLELRARASHGAAAAALGDRGALARLVRLLSENPELSLPPAYTPALARVLEHAPRDALREDFVAQLVPRAATLPSVAAGAGRNRSDCAQSGRADGRTARAHLATKRNRCAAPDHRRGPRARRRSGDGARGHARGDVPGGAAASAVGLARPHGRRGGAHRMAHAGAGHSVVRLGLRDCGGHCAEIGTHRCDHDHRLRRQCGTHARRVAGGPRRLPSSGSFRRIRTRRTPARWRAAIRMCWSTWRGCTPRPASSSRRARRAPCGRWLRPCPAMRRHWSTKRLANADRTRRQAARTARRAVSRGAGRRVNSRNGGMPRCGRISRAMRTPPPRDMRACWTRNRITLPRIACPRCSRGTAATATMADREFARAVALAPDDVDTRIAAAQLATRRIMPSVQRSCCAKELERAPYGVPLWVALGHAELARRDGDRRRAGVRPGTAFRAGGRADLFQSWRGVADGRRRGRGGACLPARAGVAAGLRVGMFQSCRALSAAGKNGRRDRGLPAGAARSIPAMPRRTRIWARSCSPPARSTHGSRISARSRRIARARCRSRCRRWKSASSRATTRSWIPMSRDCGARSFRQATSWGWSTRWRNCSACFSISTSSPKCCTGSRRRTTPRRFASMAPPRPRDAPRRPGRLRLGYLSGDLRDHVMGKQMWQAIQHHDRGRFELYFYSTTAARDAWTEKFAGIAERFDVVARLDDAAAAALIARDDLDLLVDLCAHTKGARPGILARKPARVQITHIASCGTVGLSAIDYKLTDSFADLPENAGFHDRDAAPDGRLRLSVASSGARRHAPVSSRVAWNRAGHHRHRRVRQPAQAVAALPRAVARRARPLAAREARVFAQQRRLSPAVRAYGRGSGHRRGSPVVSAAGPRRERKPVALRARGSGARYAALWRRQRDDGTTRHGRACRHAGRQAARRAVGLFDPRQPGRPGDRGARRPRICRHRGATRHRRPRSWRRCAMRFGPTSPIRR